MRRWSQIATRNWRVKPVRTTGALLAIALGTGAVVWVTCCYESVQRTVMEWAATYVGEAHVTVSSSLGRFNTIPEMLTRQFESIPGVVHTAPLLVQRLRAGVVPRGAVSSDPRSSPPAGMWIDEIDFHGIDLEREPYVREWKPAPGGRMLTPDDKLTCVLDASVADEHGVGIGDYVVVWAAGRDQPPTRLEIVGLIQRRRIARFLKGIALVRLPVLQELSGRYAVINSVDLVVDDPSQAGMTKVATELRRRIRAMALPAQVRSAAARVSQVEKAQEQQRVVLVLLASVAMLTALFIILSTLSMGMIERLTQLGLLRCTGTTRWQLAWLTIVEVFPLGVVGIVLGVPLGLGLTALTVNLVPDYVSSFTISLSGIALACTAGLVTAMIAAALPAVAAARVSPLEATRVRARSLRLWTVFLPAGLALLLMAAQAYILQVLVQRSMLFVQWSAAAVTLLYIVYALVAPLWVLLLGRMAVPVVALTLGLRQRLLHDQVGRAVWRSTGICCGLMVGLSLIVGLVVFNQNVRAGWQFPKQFPEGYIWSFEQFNGDVDAAVRRVGSIGDYTAANAINVLVEERNPLLADVLMSMSWFLGVEPDSFLDMVSMKFIDGDEETARQLLKQGDYVLVAADFARSRHKGVTEVKDKDGKVVVSNVINLMFNDRWTQFKVAGVIDSPALDIAAGYFQVMSEAYAVASGSVIGTNADLQRIFKIRGHRLVLLNFALAPDDVPPPGWTPPGSDDPEGRPTDDYYNARLPLESRWRFYRENEILRALRRELQADSAHYGSARELKDTIDSELTRVTYLLTAVPTVALLVAALGVANLMTANIAARTRQIAIMRAVGATRGQILRLVVGEALVLGVLGSGLGLALGLHLTWNLNHMTLRMWGLDVPFIVPWGMVGAAVGLTIGLCILAGVLPARYAARTNVIDALHVA